MSIPDLSPLELQEAQRLRDKIRKHVEFDACIVGLGERDPYGEVLPLRAACLAVDKEPAFGREALDEYASVAEHDMAAQLFACNATSVLNVSAFDSYPPLNGKGDAQKVGAYLRRHGLAHLNLCGVSSSRGLAWMTLYRRMQPEELAKLGKSIEAAQRGTDDVRRAKLAIVMAGYRAKAFSPADAETTSYIARAGLYELQLKCEMTSDNARLSPQRYEMIALTAGELDVALRWARGHAPKTIATARAVNTSTIEEQLKEVRKLFPRPSHLANRILGPMDEVSKMGKSRRSPPPERAP